MNKKNTHIEWNEQSCISTNEEYKNTLIGHLGILFLVSNNAEIRATMPVDERTIQAYASLSGGASLALAESIAGHGSKLLCTDEEFPCGIQVSANHIAMAKKGETVLGIGTLVSQGKSIHVWNIDVINAENTLISTARIVNKIIKKH